MVERGLRAAAVAVAALAIAVASGCGGGQKQEGSGAKQSQVVANVNGTPITRAQVAHWMQYYAASTYYAASHRGTIPAGLVSDPPNYGRCVARLEATKDGGKESSVRLLTKCRQLAEALRIDATSYLVSALRAIGLARELGVSVSDAAVRQRYTRERASYEPAEARYHRYLASQGGTAADSLLELKVEMLGAALLQRLHSPTERVRFAIAEQHWSSKIACSPGYVVEYCKGYNGDGKMYTTTPPPSVLMEQISALVTGRCTNVEACREQAHG